MSFRNLKSVLLACSGAAVLLAATTAANAGGFALREQSAAGQGSSFAGTAAGGALSSMYWNPATMTQFAGKAFEVDGTAIIPNASQTYSTSSLNTSLGGLIPSFAQGVSNSGQAAAVPATYSSWQLTDKLWLGMSVNSPFGLAVAFPTQWAGAGYGQNSSVRTLNASPSIAYKFSDMISVAAGVQVQYMSVTYNLLTGAFPTNNGVLGGSGYGYGFTLGTTITPTPTTTIGIGYRSAINQKIDGTLAFSSTIAGSTPGGINTTLNLPDQLSVGLRQRIGDQFTLLAGFEWSGWGRIGTAIVNTSAGTPAMASATAAITLPFQYSNGSFYSLGGEYAWDPRTTLRAGIAYEKSPITDGVRTPRLPDNDRMWYSIGATYKSPDIRGLSFDVGYSYIDVKNTPINISATSGNPWFNSTGTYIGSVSSNIHIISLALRYQWDNVTPVTRTALITK